MRVCTPIGLHLLSHARSGPQRRQLFLGQTSCAEDRFIRHRILLHVQLHLRVLQSTAWSVRSRAAITSSTPSAGVDACAEMNRCMENIELVAAPDMPNKKMFVTHCGHPVQSQGLHPQALRHADPQPLPERSGTRPTAWIRPTRRCARLLPSTMRSARSSPRSATCASSRIRPSPVMSSMSSTWLAYCCPKQQDPART